MSACEHGRPEDDCPECDAWAADFLATWANSVDLGDEVGAACGACGGAVYMETCTMSTGSGHDWVVASECQQCGLRNPIECPECGGEP